MEDKKEYKREYKPQLVEIETKIKTYLSERFINQVKFLVSKYPSLEWSGILFYSIKGDILDPETMEIILQYIYLMDVGTAGSTKYETDESVVGFRMDNPDMLRCKIGHIHSHNLMNVFFSGEDTDELIENSEFHNFYLSIIVNTKLQITGKVAFRASPADLFLAKNSQGETYKLQIPNVMPYVFVYQCTIVSEIPHYVDQQFIDRFAQINRAKEEKTAAAQAKSVGTWNRALPTKSFHEKIDYDPNDKIDYDPDMNISEDISSDIDDFACYNICADQGIEDDTAEIYEMLGQCADTEQIFGILSEAKTEIVDKILNKAVNDISTDAMAYYGLPIEMEEVYKEYLLLLADIQVPYPLASKMITMINERVASIYHKSIADKITTT